MTEPTTRCPFDPDCTCVYPETCGGFDVKQCELETCACCEGGGHEHQCTGCIDCDEGEDDGDVEGVPTIRLRCPCCFKTVMRERADWDPPNAATIEILCPRCTGGDFDLVCYLDADGKEILPTDEAIDANRQHSPNERPS